jgi:hypothetical protein
MPTITATVAQVLRYFITGAYAIMLLRLATPGRYPGIEDNGIALAAMAMVLGTLTYCLHRALIHPLISRGLMLALLPGPVKNEWGWQCPYWPLQVEADIALTRYRRRAPHRRDIAAYFGGWAGEVHLLYMAIEWTAAGVILSLPCLGIVTSLIALAFVGAAACAWDLSLLRVQIHAWKQTSDRSADAAW